MVNNRLGSKNWTIEEIKYMQFSWGFVTVKSISKHLKRTPVAVALKAERLNLGSPYSRSTRFTAQKLAKLLGVDIHTITDYWIKKCGLKARRTVMKFKKAMYLTDLDNLMDWLQRNQDKWDSRRVKRFALIIEPEWLRNKRILDSYEPRRKKQKWNKFEDLRLLDLFYKKRKKVKEIAEVMGRSYSAAEHRLSRVRPYKKVGILEASNVL